MIAVFGAKATITATSIAVAVAAECIECKVSNVCKVCNACNVRDAWYVM